jgi:hypothetical protein
MGHYLFSELVDVAETRKDRFGGRRRRRGGGTARLKGRSWEARWSENGERRRQGGFATKSDAEAFIQQRSRSVVLAEGLADLGLPVPVERPKAKVRTIGSLAEEFFEVRKAEGIKTVGEDRWRWDRHLAPFLSSRVLRKPGHTTSTRGR